MYGLNGSIPRTVPVGLLTLALVPHGLFCACLLYIELTIGGGMAHMQIRPWALPLYMFALILTVCLRQWAVFRSRPQVKDSNPLPATAAFVLAALVSGLVGLRAVLLMLDIGTDTPWITLGWRF